LSLLSLSLRNLNASVSWNSKLKIQNDSMTQSLSNQQVTQWVSVCSLNRILPNTGICALVNGEQIAVFRVCQGKTGQSETVYAINNHDPFSKAQVLSRGIVGDRNGIPKVASPIYKQNFNLLTGQCLDDETISVMTYPVQVVDGQVQIGMIN
jgi:nitrite reductase (NADH) small subunit